MKDLKEAWCSRNQDHTVLWLHLNGTYSTWIPQTNFCFSGRRKTPAYLIKCGTITWLSESVCSVKKWKGSLEKPNFQSLTPITRSGQRRLQSWTSPGSKQGISWRWAGTEMNPAFGAIAGLTFQPREKCRKPWRQSARWEVRKWLLIRTSYLLLLAFLKRNLLYRTLIQR